MMVNQDPQPEVFTTTFENINYANATSVTNVIYTHQGHAEQVLIYAIGVDVTVSADGSSANLRDFDITITAGANNVPSNPFDGGAIFDSRDKVISFSCPIVVNFKQPLQVKLTIPNHTTGGDTVDVEVRLIGETSILKR